MTSFELGFDIDFPPSLVLEYHLIGDCVADPSSFQAPESAGSEIMEHEIDICREV